MVRLSFLARRAARVSISGGSVMESVLVARITTRLRALGTIQRDWRSESGSGMALTGIGKRWPLRAQAFVALLNGRGSETGRGYWGKVPFARFTRTGMGMAGAPGGWMVTVTVCQAGSFSLGTERKNSTGAVSRASMR